MENMKAKLIAYRVRKGHSRAESAALLEEILTSWSTHNLAYALHYNNFATECGADKAVEVADSMKSPYLADPRMAPGAPFNPETDWPETLAEMTTEQREWCATRGWETDDED
jgi:hypothetical protein